MGSDSQSLRRSHILQAGPPGPLHSGAWCRWRGCPTSSELGEAKSDIKCSGDPPSDVGLVLLSADPSYNWPPDAPNRKWTSTAVGQAIGALATMEQ